jgi:hypothetical protein
MASRVAFFVMTAKERPDDLFSATFFDIREKTKELKKKWSEQAQQSLSNTLINDLKGKGINPIDFKLSLGQYRGSKFVTSAKFKAKMKDKESADKLLSYLQARYSPKYKLKSVSEPEEDGVVVAAYNIR